jgi:hypothetical protein
MYPVIEAYLASGQTQKVFCAEYGLAVAVLGYWLRRYRQERSGAGGFVEVSRPEATSAPLVEIAYPGGVSLRFFAPVEPSYLERLLPA